ncbi:hypothetical protein KZZ08_18230 [Roseovarius mucosus]|uniref:peroxidase family protein n=1 Tax=Roseovarius mucosus TaxID=215743 RepID=UPI001C5F7D22|nr:peroxidase family protein [Roseovarius mucosus]MBW4975574.1 hypothetical protein [Roseovarius mucosus]
MVHLNTNDLAHILEQIRIAEDHSRLIAEGVDPGAALSQLVSSPLIPYGLRTVDGSFNNFQPGMERFGASDEVMTRLLTPVYNAAEANPRNGAPTSYDQANGTVYDSQPRVISNLVADQSLNNPAAIAGALASLGITGAAQLNIVREIMAAQQAARDARAAVEDAEAAYQALYDAAQQQVDDAESELALAGSALAAAQEALNTAEGLLTVALAAQADAQAAITAQQAVVDTARAASDAAMADSLAADEAEATALTALNIATVQRALAQQAEAAALAAYGADPSPENLQAYLDAREVASDANIAFLQAEDTHEDAVTAATAASAAFTAANQTLIVELSNLSGLQATLDGADDALATAQADVDAAQAAVTEAETVDAAAQAELDEAIAARDAIPTGTDATAAAAAAADAADQAVLDMVASHGIEMDGDNVFIRNIAADLGDTASFNSFMTIFGQFFDHGLDLTSKGGNGNVIIQLHPDDPLYVEGSPTNFMVLTRATNDPGADGLIGTADDVRDHANQTTPWIDLNQLYTSNPSHQVFLREYAMVDRRPQATGRMLESEAGGPPTWADVKSQARDLLGIELSDLNAVSVPLLVTDLYGEFERGANDLPQLMTADGPVEGNLASPIDGMSGLSAGRAFLDDIAHNAVPGTFVVDRFTGETAQKTPDADDIAGNPIIPNEFGQNATYDNELLDAHYIVGDGRGNENIALTSIHTVFHGEHNRQIEEIQETLLSQGATGEIDIAFLNQWLLVPVEAGFDPASLVWDGERLFQAARFSTEMVYQHLVFEEFVRSVTPQIDPFVFSNSVEVDGAIFEEFAQVVYRFGHSMLNETVPLMQLSPEGVATPEEVGLIEAFLNPIAFAEAGVDAHAAAGAILRGISTQAGNEIDEFMTSALRNNLVGLPLDLAALNIARARETGIPSLNEARRQFFEATNDTFLRPYESWSDFAANIKNPLSVVNFIAAYGTHASVLAAVTTEEKREAAWEIVFGGDGAPEDRLDYLNSTGDWADLESGLNRVDFWIGGLAEALMPFGGMLGSTFSFVFEMQIENLQAGDRFYYLSRTQGMNLLTQLESDSFADLIARNTNTADLGFHVNGAAFQTADYVIEMDQSRQYNEGLENADPTREADVLSAITGTQSLVTRRDTDGDGDIDFIQFHGGEHVVLGGTDENDTIVGGAGDDGIWGGDGDDRIEGGFGVDHVHGGAGNDIITDSGTDIGDADVLKGEGGDDVINGGMGIDLIFGGSGSDFLSGGSEAKDIFGGEGDDFIRAASGGGGVVYGNEGNDWMEAQGFMTTLTGDNSELFFNSRVIGHDVMLSGENDTDFDAESGDDIMVQGIGINRNNGMAGFDWVSYQGNNYAADADMNVGIFVNQQNNILRDRYDLVEGLSGWNYDDTLTGREVVVGAYDANGNATQVDADAPIASFSNALLERNVDLINGLRELVAHLERFEIRHPDGTTEEVEVGVLNTAAGEDILLGGGGSDLIRGMAGNDILDGDRYLNVRIGLRDENGAEFATAAGMTAQVFGLDGSLLFGGATVESLMFSRTLTPGQLFIIREIIDGGQADDIDTAVYWDLRENYEVTDNGDGSYTVTHLQASAELIDPVTGIDLSLDPLTGRRLEQEGSDRLTNIEVLRFADGDIAIELAALNDAPVTGAPVLSDQSPTETQGITVDLSAIADPDGIASIAVQWQSSLDGGATWTDIPGATGVGYTPPAAATAAQPILRVAATVTDLNGNVSIVVSAASDVVGDVINGTGGANTLNGGSGGDLIDAGGGNDTVNAGASDDVIVWNASGNGFLGLGADGRDVVNGGTESLIGDTFVVNGTDLAETYRVYSAAAWVALGGARPLEAGTEIVITRNGTANGNVIAELQEIEEIVINTNGGGFFSDNDQVLIIGDFSPTNLSFNTITINGGAGDDVVDITGLDSAHRILFRTAGGNDMVVGTLRAQDVIEAPAGVDPASYAASFDELTGLVTLTAEGSTITFSGAPDSLPQVVTASEVEHGDDDDDDDDDHDSHHDENNQDTVDDEATDPTQPESVASFVSGTAEADDLTGTDGAELILAGDGNDVVDAGSGDDIIEGGNGSDVLFGGDGNDTFLINHDGATDFVFGGLGQDIIDLTGLSARAEITLDSLSSLGSIRIGNTFDRISSIEDVIGGSGNDTIIAGESENNLAGGAGNDTFRFDTASAADGDFIHDFAPGDRIDLSRIDAVTGQLGNQSFTLMNEGDPIGAGSLVLTELSDGVTNIAGHLDDDGSADFTLKVRNSQSLSADDFNL